MRSLCSEFYHNNQYEYFILYEKLFANLQHKEQFGILGKFGERYDNNPAFILRVIRLYAIIKYIDYIRNNRKGRKHCMFLLTKYIQIYWEVALVELVPLPEFIIAVKNHNKINYADDTLLIADTELHCSNS